MFANHTPFHIGDEAFVRSSNDVGSIDDCWAFQNPPLYSHGLGGLDNVPEVAFRQSEIQRRSNIQRLLRSDEPVVLSNHVRSWSAGLDMMYLKPAVDQEGQRFELRTQWQQPTDYPTPPWSSPRDERSTMDRDSLSTGSVWSSHMSEADHEIALAGRPSPVSDVSPYEPCHKIPSYPGNASYGGTHPAECIAPSALQFPDREADAITTEDADAEGDSEDFSVDPALQEPSNMQFYTNTAGYVPLRPTSTFPVKTDEGHASSNHRNSVPSTNGEDDDMDMDGEYKDDDGSDYKPSKRTKGASTRRASRTSKLKSRDSPRPPRRSSNGLSNPAKIRKQPSKSSVLRPSSLSSSPYQHQKTCSSCAQTWPTLTALNKHILTAHTRPFICTFARYGCPATFGSKNEYKRHVSSQHLRPGIYRCDLGSCVPEPNPPRSRKSSSSVSFFAKEKRVTEGYNEFNRKDLFTQHVRRMHGPPHSHTSEAEKERFEASLEEIRTRCWIKLHEPPPRSVCGFCAHSSSSRGGGKPVVFEGRSGWEERMEHVARHLERGEKEEEEDVELREWMVKEGLIRWVGGGQREGGEGGGGGGGGRWRVVGTGKKRAGEDDGDGDGDGEDVDVDAEGEED